MKKILIMFFCCSISLAQNKTQGSCLPMLGQIVDVGKDVVGIGENVVGIGKDVVSIGNHITNKTVPDILAVATRGLDIADDKFSYKSIFYSASLTGTMFSIFGTMTYIIIQKVKKYIHRKRHPDELITTILQILQNPQIMAAITAALQNPTEQNTVPVAVPGTPQ